MTLDAALSYLRNEVAPRANVIDRDSSVLKEVLNGMFARGLMGLKISAQLGGSGLSESEFREFQIEAARASGTFAFLQTQHQSAGSMLSRSERGESFVREMARGGRKIGIGFSQLRRKGPPIMKATPDSHGFRLNGLVPWVTGFGFYDEFLLGATLPDGQSLFAVVPLHDYPGATLSEPMRLTAMEAAQTVSVQFDDYAIRGEDVVMIQPADFIARNDMINIALQGHFAIGCALAGADSVRATGEKRELPFVVQAADKLYEEIRECREAMEESGNDQPEVRLRLRAWVIELAVRSAHAAITAASGAANDVHHPAQRIYREALVFTVSAQTTEIMDSTLQRLCNRRRWFPSDE